MTDETSSSGTSFATTAVDTNDPRTPSQTGPRASGETWIPPRGTVIAGRYRVEHVVGEGGMGAVVAATHIALEERVALKFLHPRHANDKESTTRFLREAQASARIRSEHVVRVTDVGTGESGMPFIAMELLEGEDLEAAVRDKPMPVELAVDCVLEAAEALAEAHAAGIIHRDIKPANLWLARRSDGSAHVKVLDFGISKQAKSDARATTGLTQTQSVFGSPTYMSPEQIRSAKHVDFRTDVWSLAIVLFELLCGRRPFEGETVSAMLAAIAADHPIPIRTYDPNIPEEIEELILQCLKKDAIDRPTLPELAAVLRPYASRSGQLVADRIASLEPAPSVIAPVGTSSANIRPRGNPPSGPITGRAASRRAVDRTDGQLGMTNPSREPRRGSASRGAYAIAGSILIVGIGALGYALFAQPSSAPRATTARPATPPPPPPPPPSVSAASSSAPPPASETAAPPASVPLATERAPSAPRTPPRPRPPPPAQPSATSPPSSEEAVPPTPPPTSSSKWSPGRQ